jgi:opacity protein-like surface antigen
MKNLLISASCLALSLSAIAAPTKGAPYSPPPAPPQDNLNWGQNWYIGFGINADAASNLQGQPDAFVGVEIDELELDSTAIGFDVYLGRSINDHFAVELGYTFVGNVELDLSSESSYYSGKVEQWDLHAVALGRWPIGDYVNLMIKGGAAWYENSQNLKNINSDLTTHDKYSGFALTYGGGLEVFWDQFGVRADYTAILPPNRADDMFYVSDLIGMSFIYKFK